VRPSWRRSEGAAFVGLAFAAMTVSIMQTMVVPILGAISSHLGTSLADTSWVLTATLVSAAVLTPIFGRLGDQRGKRRMLVACLSLVTVGSLVAALAPSLGVLVVGRALQGAGTGVFPLALSLLRDRVPARQLTTRMAFISTTLMTGGGIGLVLTGAVVQGGRGYQAVFWLAAALSLLALLGVALLVSESLVTRSGRIDWLGAVLFSALLTLLLLALAQGATWGWTSTATLACVGGAAVCAVAWVIAERQVPEPLIDLAMFLHRPVLLVNVAALLLGLAMYCQFIGVATLVQLPGYGFGATIERAAVQFLLPSALTAAVVAPLGGVLVNRIGANRTLGLGALGGVAAFGGLAIWHHEPLEVVVATVAGGCAVALTFASMPALIVAAVPLAQTGIANGLNAISRSVGASVASAVVAAVLTAAQPRPGGLPGERAFTAIFLLAATVCAVAAVAAAQARPRRA
ncbi:MAG TPA: MFS transporter, partial [Candidatus Dormibacteraeota bacterium]